MANADMVLRQAQDDGRPRCGSAAPCTTQAADWCAPPCSSQACGLSAAAGLSRLAPMPYNVRLHNAALPVPFSRSEWSASSGRRATLRPTSSRTCHSSNPSSTDCPATSAFRSWPAYYRISLTSSGSLLGILDHSARAGVYSGNNVVWSHNVA